MPRTHPRACMLAFALMTLCSLPGRAGAQADLAAPTFDQQFWAQWSDGKAELAAYDLTYPRYGELREGAAVAIFVKEPFSKSLRVKADPGEHPETDVFPVMKLNLVQDFPTGIYDYSLMTSTFIALESVEGLPVGAPTKISFSAQEWCGHQYQQLVFEGERIGYQFHSYFDGEADKVDSLPYKTPALAEDALLPWVRGMVPPVLEAGETREVYLLSSLERARLKHTPLAWEAATLNRAAEPRVVTVPAGTFTANVFTVLRADGERWTFFVQADFPHRILQWESSVGHRAQLLGVQRLKYWEMNGPGLEQSLRELGLSPRPPRTP